MNAVDAPSTAGYCHIDIVHNSTALNFSFVPADQRPEVFGPFIRVINSFNGLRALGFDIGFYRKVCKNGLIVPDTIIRFKFTHMRRDIGKTVHFEIEQERLAKFKTAFTDSLSGLRNCVLRRPEFEPLLCGVLLLRPPQAVNPIPVKRSIGRRSKFTSPKLALAMRASWAKTHTRRSTPSPNLHRIRLGTVASIVIATVYNAWQDLGWLHSMTPAENQVSPYPAILSRLGKTKAKLHPGSDLAELDDVGSEARRCRAL